MSTADHARDMATVMIDAAETYLCKHNIPLTMAGSGTIIKEAIRELIRAMGAYDKHFAWRTFAEIRREQAGSNQ